MKKDKDDEPNISDFEKFIRDTNRTNSTLSVNQIVESAGALAEFMKITFDAYTKAGFTEKQALTLTQGIIRLCLGLG